VANNEHLALLRQGSVIWNEWRRSNPDIRADLRWAGLADADLTGADLHGADLHGAYLDGAALDGADLRSANLIRADLRRADLTGANLTGANLNGADLRRADLTGANFTGASLRADLGEADLRSANLNGADLTGADLYEAALDGANLNDAVFYETILGNVDLNKTIGLDNCHHYGPSIIDFRTLSRSGNLPISFLRGCGLPDNLIDYLPSFRGNALQFYSCFISYSAKDQIFADRLYADLQNKGVRCWIAPHDLPIGAKTWDAIDQAIRLRDKLLLILSKSSIASEWVEDEVNKAYAEERSRKQIVLFPIRIDNVAMSTAEPWAVKLRDQRNIGDFRQWKKPDAYQRSLDRLLRDLRTAGPKPNRSALDRTLGPRRIGWTQVWTQTLRYGTKRSVTRGDHICR
jgi:uncharacterized protein YjbI with pentapeptide repeats